MVLVISVLFVIIVTITSENKLNSVSDSFAAASAVSDKILTKKLIDISNSLQSSNLQVSLQQDSLNNSNLDLSNSSSLRSDSNSNNITLPQVKDPNLTVEVVINGLNMPTTMAFLGKDDFLILQKNGSLIRVYPLAYVF